MARETWPAMLMITASPALASEVPRFLLVFAAWPHKFRLR